MPAGQWTAHARRFCARGDMHKDHREPGQGVEPLRRCVGGGLTAARRRAAEMGTSWRRWTPRTKARQSNSAGPPGQAQ